eukprot:4236407-Prymnesium_polylepis.1
MSHVSAFGTPPLQRAMRSGVRHAAAPTSYAQRGAAAMVRSGMQHHPALPSTSHRPRGPKGRGSSPQRRSRRRQSSIGFGCSAQHELKLSKMASARFECAAGDTGDPKSGWSAQRRQQQPKRRWF